MRAEIIKSIETEKLIAIVRGIQSEKCMKVADALYVGGVRLMEITYDQSRPESWEQTALAIGNIAQAFRGRMVIGAGTVISSELVELTHAHGGQFIISPDANAPVIERTRELGMVSIPGALSPTEVLLAHRAGADFVKVFPASSFGPGYIKAICSPISHVKILAVGGINESNAASYLAAGAVGVGVGGNLANRAWIDQGAYENLTEAARRISVEIHQ